MTVVPHDRFAGTGIPVDLKDGTHYQIVWEELWFGIEASNMEYRRYAELILFAGGPKARLTVDDKIEVMVGLSRHNSCLTQPGSESRFSVYVFIRRRPTARPEFEFSVDSIGEVVGILGIGPTIAKLERERLGREAG